MHVADDRLIASATDLSGYLACNHLTSLALEATQGGPKPPKFPDPGAEVLRERGHQHEAEILARYRDQGLDVAELGKPDWSEGRDGAWPRYAARTLEAMRQGKDVIYQACLFDGRWLGLPDFLIRVEGKSELGEWAYEVVDAKLARSAKVGAVLQICFYSEMLERAQGAAPDRMHLALGGAAEPGGAGTEGVGAGATNGADSGLANGAHEGIESFRCSDFAAYYRSVKDRFLGQLADQPATYPEPCDHCTVCDWSPVCKERWEADDHLSLVAGITRRQRAELEAREVATLTGLAGLPLPPETRLDSVSDPALTKIREQARIQLEGRKEGPRYELLLDAEDGTGLMALPEPSPGDLFFDIEGDPHAFGDGLEYLLGWVGVDGRFTGLWALDREEERRRFEDFIDGVMARLEEHPDLHIYHYAAYEKTALKRLAARHATREDEVDRLLRGKVLVDLHRVVRQGIRASVRSYSIKKLEPLYGFTREVELREASSALANFEAWLQLGGVGGCGGAAGRGAEAEALLAEIEGYNEDDCVSTLRLRAWLEERRAELEDALTDAGRIEGPLPRPEPPEADASDAVQEESERVQALMDALTDGVPDDPAERSDEETAKWTLAQLLSWHRREKKSMWWEYFRLVEMDDDELLHDAKALSGLEYEGEVGTVKRSVIHRYRFPRQDFAIRRKDKPRDPRTEKGAGEVMAVDAEACAIDLKRGKSSDAPHPTSLIPFEDVPDGILKESLQRLADDVVTHGLEGARNRAAVDLLLRRPPRAGQAEGESLRRPDETNLEAARRIAPCLERTVLPVQGPPGSGKTYIGARMIVSLIAAGKRVGVTATSHKVIVNLLDEVCRVADDEGVAVRGVQKASEKNACAHEAIERAGSNAQVEALVADGEVDLVAGTAWLWSRDGMQDSVDVLFVDEAGQMSLANVLAASGAAGSIVLLGDPQQLEQPQQGVHPPGTDVAALEHLVGPETLRPARGLFLNETWRLHPDICAFTSELYYQGRLSSRLELARQSVEAPPPFGGAGLRFHPVAHEANSNESAEEVAEIARLVGGLLAAEPAWVDAGGARGPLGIQDILVVAPYNAQVTALREALPAGMRVGTVDKFQGQEAPIVLYSMATSSVRDAPRGMEFLFSPNRLNVATSRARCVVVVVGSAALLGPDCRSVRQMRLANGLCRFGEMAGGEVQYA